MVFAVAGSVPGLIVVSAPPPGGGGGGGGLITAGVFLHEKIIINSENKVAFKKR